MSRLRNSSEIDLHQNSAYRSKPRHSLDHKKVLQLKISHESPYSKIPSMSKIPSISKIRSISTLKHKSHAKNRSISPSLSKLVTDNSSLHIISHKMIPTNSQRSIHEFYTKKPPKIRNSIKNPVENKNNSKVYDTSDLEIRLKSLENQKIEDCISEYYKIFEDIIERDIFYGKLLKKIKESILIWTKTIEKSTQESFKKQLNEANKKLNAMLEDRQIIDRRLKQISQENLDLCKSLENCEASYAQIEEKLLKITNFKLENIVKEESNWKALVLQNRSYIEITKRMKEDLKVYRSKEKKLLELILAMKNRGYPIEEIYNSDVYKASDAEENSESDRIISGRAKDVIKPCNVPTLRIDKIGNETFSSDSSDSMAC